MNNIDRFDALIAEIDVFYKDSFQVDLRVLKPKLVELFGLIGRDLANRKLYTHRLELLVGRLASARHPAEVQRLALMLDFCSRLFVWPEVGIALKAEYSRAGLDAQLEIVRLIQVFYDPAWRGGEVEFVGPDMDVWENVSQKQNGSRLNS